MEEVIQEAKRIGTRKRDRRIQMKEYVTYINGEMILVVADDPTMAIEKAEQVYASEHNK